MNKAALRVLMTGGAVTQSIASKWVPGGKICPHCKLADETLYHRLWQCPRWQAVGDAELHGCTLARLQRHFCNSTLCTGLVPSDALCRAAAAIERATANWPAPVVLPPRAWSDGSGLWLPSSTASISRWGMPLAPAGRRLAGPNLPR